MSTLINPVFTGVSSYANDLQNIITRAVSIANLPVEQLQTQLQTYNGQSTALKGLDDKFTALQKAIEGLSGAAGPDSLSGASSDAEAAAVHVAAGAVPDSYTLDILDAGASSTSVSKAALPAVADPSTSSISSSSTFTLSVNGTNYSLTPAGRGLSDLVTAINQSGAGVQASLINTGNSGSPNYRLVIRSKNLAADSIQLNDGSANLLDTLNTGKPALYTLNGLSGQIQSNSRTVTVAPGVTVDLLQQTDPDQPITITVSRDSSTVETAVSTFVDAYNAAVDVVDAQVGQNAGALSGQSIVYSLRSSLSQITQFSQSGAVGSLSQMGITLDTTGKLSLNTAQFESNDLTAVQAFLGATGGTGFLGNASQAMSLVEDPTTGALPAAEQSMTDQISKQNDLISDNQQRVDDMQNNLTQQMSAADATLAQLENQKNYFNNLFTAMMNSNLNGAGVKSN